MVEPFSFALLGAVVSQLLTEAITAARKAYHCRENCKKLLATLEELEPLVNKVKENSDRNDTCKEFLSGFQKLLEDARSAAENCALKSGVRKRERLMHIWRLRKLPSRIMGINSQIKDKIANSGLLTLLVTLSIEKQVTAVTTTSRFEFTTQPVPKKVVGLEGHFDKLKTLVIAGHGKDSPSYLGLKGRGGAGKTVLAQELNNDDEIRATYEADSILWITIGLDASVSSLYSTMGGFLRDEEFEKHYRHSNEEDQRTYLMNAFSKKKMLLILDDVWEKQYKGRQLIEWLDIAKGPGSVTLITTREDSVLSRKKAEVVVVLELSEEDSWELFCYHAFESSMPPSSEIEEIARNMCKECKGLPLALKVVGNAMLDKLHIREWRSFLRDLEKSEADSNVVEELFYCLGLSFNELDDVTKKCFLYFAAFPEDYAINIKQLFTIWISDGLFGSLEAEEAVDKARACFGILARRSLIDWDHESNGAKVHDILRDLAINIIRKAQHGEWAYKCLFQPGSTLKAFPRSNSMLELTRMSLMGSRIFELPNNLRFPHLRTCLLSRISNPTEKVIVPEGFFPSMIDLRYLDLSQNYFEGKFPSFKGLESLMVLNFSNCNLLKLSESIRELKSLIDLDLSDSGLLKKLPENIGELKCLTDFDLSECGSLEELPKSIGELKHLTYLNMSGCGSLKELAASIGELKCLSHLNLSWCRSLKKLPESIGDLKCLFHLNLSRCASLEGLPESIGELKCLTHFNLCDCGLLEELPESIGGLKSLTHLDLRDCESLEELPKSIEELKCLAHLNLCDCRMLKELPTSMVELERLIYLNLSGCSLLREVLESIRELKCLSYLNLNWHGSLEELPESIGELNYLTHLSLSGCGSLEGLPESIGDLKCLTHLDLSRCRLLMELPESMGELKCLSHLNLNGCTLLMELPKSIGDLKCLTDIDLNGCILLNEFPKSKGELECCTHLDLSQCGGLLEKLPKRIVKLKCLTHLNLSRCGSLKQLSENIVELKCLIHLNLSWCTSLKELPKNIGELKCLTQLHLNRCGSLKEIPKNIGDLKYLTQLHLNGCGSLKQLPQSIGELKCLNHLDLSQCQSLKELPQSIGELKCLNHLDLFLCVSLKELPENMGELKYLIHLNLSQCASLKKLSKSIGELKCLNHLDLSWCGSLKKLPERIGELECLIHLNLSQCRSLKGLPESIGELKCLTHLNLSGCALLKGLPESIGKLKSLVHFNLYDCGLLEELPKNIGELKCLIDLDLRKCKSLKELPESIKELKYLPESIEALTWN